MLGAREPSRGWSAHAQAATRDVARGLASLASLYHHGKLELTEPLPAGPVLLVGNHGVYGYETPIFFYLLHRATGRFPLGLADHHFFKLPIVRSVLPWLGGVRGTREAAVSALRRGALVVCYPGVVKEVFKHRRDRYRLRWEGSLGFLQVAAAAGAVIAPFAGSGVDDAFALLDKDRFSWRLGASDKYLMPLAFPMPRPAPFHFRIGRPRSPPRRGSTRLLVAFREGLAQEVRALLREAAHG